MMSKGKTIYLRLNPKSKEAVLVKAIPNDEILNSHWTEELTITALFYPKDYIVELNLNRPDLQLSPDQQNRIVSFIRGNAINSLTYDLAQSILHKDDKNILKVTDKMLAIEEDALV